MKNENQALPVSKNEKIKVTFEDLTSEGLGVAKVDSYPLFVIDGLPGEEAIVKVTKLGKSYGFARIEERLSSSEDRIPTTDVLGTQVGTMPLQHMRYEAQLKFKQNMVIQDFKRIAKLPDIEVLPTIGMKQPWGYRNKAQIPVRAKDGKLVTGFFRKNTHDLVPMENFHIQDPKIDEAIVKVRDILQEYGVKAYDEKKHTGNIRHIMVRRGTYTGEMMIVLVTRTAKIFPKSKIVPDILEALPEVVSIVQNVNPKRSNVILGEETIILHGEDLYHDTLLGHKFAISSKSFYQVNPLQTEKLYQLALDAAQLTGEETVIDAYCGIGTISLALAEKAKQVYAMEIVPDAIEMAKRNAEENNIENVTFEIGAAEEVMPKWAEEGIQADVIVVDPPRKGLDAGFIEAALTVNPDRIVYVSCNPATLSRDLRIFADNGYEAKQAQPVDLFPQTLHVETVVALTKIK
ncbi:23S rRNA (uracil(1939)-C(5))-methyltransferase RlmD [Jeotgalibaca ciconiae]|uniref:23S rRNA (Uracil(1939)-C(5))-methyltransferase RlmD n=2 Tax=Jeotgalibaca TaxID=1470540 RepID=A0A3Q9BKP5_9LACT|nr:23S rRNA (uracil(1939)-C(5))-methyltransferase RlmD [Jeotgalibaca ciconiae]AZP04671.1 23S rRNA (uracil(1939)-C(5))-methyltransferase RlmD [Jeotgalibaca ciconiae]HJA90701.1 23S rRNA (uracil(1939)-C(5))-methyltransferase RlmD [Candidatus Jeotgalibaca merdavium]HJB24047.1 23S rRNA (uracil(1939)-C(5))-methyltransferase RlmD [Candidatus Jeotgalibaca pullicola]